MMQAAQDEGSVALLKRLDMTGDKFDQAVRSVRAVAGLPDPLARTIRASRLDRGLDLYQVTVPIGVVACAYESRPDAGIQIIALALRSGNAIILKGGREAQRTNQAVVEAARSALETEALPVDCVVGLHDRGELADLLALDQFVDLMIPRGSTDFVRHVMDVTRIPVLGHADGVCHTYIHEGADVEAALRVCVDAKTDYPAACNATECFLIHRAIASTFIPRLEQALADARVEVHADETASGYVGAAPNVGRGERGHEYGDLTALVAVVDSLDAAIDWINTYGSKHTDAILTSDAQIGRTFCERVDAAGVFVNASTRFSDGYRYGLGAEVGISTAKIHHRGPVGLEGLTTQKWLLMGSGQRAADYQGPNARAFLHEPRKETWPPG